MDVLIATHARPDYLEETLSQVVEKGSSHGVSQIVVVENGGEFGARSICRKIDSPIPINYQFYPDANKSASLNYGLRFCTDGLVFMTDDDVVISDDLFAEYKSAMTRYPSNAFFAGPTYPIYEREPDSWIVSVLPSSARGWSLETGKFGPDDVAMGFNWAGYKCDLVDAGGFNPDFGPGSDTGATGQESNMQRRLIERGIVPFYLERAKVGHRVPQERCNQQWMLTRAKRQGIEYGLRRAVKAPSKINRLMVGQYLLTLRFGLTALFSPSRENKLRWKIILGMNTGVREGLRLFKKGQLRKPPFPGLFEEAND